MWDSDTMKVIKVVDMPQSDGLMESRLTGQNGKFWLSRGLGKL